MIQAEHLRKRYRKKVAVDDISFTVETGKVTGFLRLTPGPPYEIETNASAHSY